ncbi:MAG: hypothetical protein EZS28_048584, partial [Streblomastix strix]
MLLKKLK